MTPKARVCIISPEVIGPHRNGGIGTHCYYLAAFLSQQLAQDVTFLYTGPMERRDPEHWRQWFQEKLGVSFVWLPPAENQQAVPQNLRSHYAQVAGRTFSWLRQQQFDACHFQEMLGNGFRCFQAKRLGLAFQNTTLTCTVHSPWEWVCEAMQSLPLAGLEELQTKFMERGCIEQADVLISLNHYMLGWLEAHQVPTPARKVILPNLFDPELKSVAYRQASHHLIFFGRLEVRKGLLLFLETLAQMRAQGAFAGRKLRVSFLGRSGYTPDGGGLESIQKYRAQLSPALELEILTELGQPEALAYLRQHNDALVVCPSLIDNSPYAVIESLQLGLNLIAANSGGIPELFSGAERLFAPEPKALAEMLRAGLNHELPPPAKRYDQEATTALWRQFCTETVPSVPPQRAAAGSQAASVRVIMALESDEATAMRALQALAEQTLKSFSATVLAQNPSATVVDYCREHGWQMQAFDPGRRLGSDRVADDNGYILFLGAGAIAQPGLLAQMVRGLDTSGLAGLACWAALKHFVYEPLGPCLEGGLFNNYLGAGCVMVRAAVAGKQGLLAASLWQGGGIWCYLAELAAQGQVWDVLPEVLLTLEGPAAFSGLDLDYASQMALLRGCSQDLPRWVRRFMLNTIGAEYKLATQQAPAQREQQALAAVSNGAPKKIIYKVKRETRRIFKQCQGLFRRN